MIIHANGPFDFEKSYHYMAGEGDCLYETCEGKIRKAESIDGYKILFELSYAYKGIQVSILVNEGVSSESLSRYITEWFDLSYDLNDFYKHAKYDTRLSPYIKDLCGFRMIGYIDIANAFLWAILGQQINMNFAYELKRRVIEHFNYHMMYEGKKYMMMPKAGEIADLSIDELRAMQISGRKAEYIKNTMAYIDEGILSKENLRNYQSYEEVIKFLVSFRGIGPWSANTVLMRALKFRNAVPIGDAGLRNILEKTDHVVKPSKQYIESEMRQYGEYGMYATVYLWEILKMR